MASIYDLKPKFQALLRPLVGALANKGITANQVTVFAVLLSVITGIFLAFFPTSSWALLSIPIVLFVRMGLNAIDGMLAREFNMKSSLGAVLNELGDVVADTALYLPFALLNPSYAPLVVIVVVLAIISEMTGVIAVQIGAERRYDGPMGKSDRAFVFGAVALLVGLGVTPSFWLFLIWIAMIALLSLTILNRTKKALQNV